tara:strand:+ start:241 stop:699 length:459 start_codon:yes stop_codon:yes gene_type:complete
MDLKAFISENVDIILVAGAIILGFTLIKLATKILFRIIIFLVILIGIYMGYQQVLGKNIIDDLSNLYCETENLDLVKCTCFIEPILNDLSNRFSIQEIEQLKQNKLKSNAEFIKSYKTKELEIKNCFERLGESTILEEILKDIKKNGLKILK